MKKIVITGASRGVGRALSLALASPGTSLVLIARQPQDLESVVRLCEAKGATVSWHPGFMASMRHPRSDATLLSFIGRRRYPAC